MKKILCSLIAIAMMLSVFAACNDASDNSEAPSKVESQVTEQSNGVTSDSESSTEEDKPYGWDLPVKDLNGRVFYVLCRDYGANSTSILGYNGEVIQRPDFDEETADMVDVEKFRVRKNIEEKYNCEITGTFSSATSGDFNQIVRQSVLAGDPRYDMVFDAYGYMYAIITEDLYVDLKTIETIDFSNPWWDQNAVRDLSICNKLYFACGDINTYDNDGTWVVYYNKELAADVFPDVNFYNLVHDNEWTFDKLVELTKAVSRDTDGVDGMSEFDTWGLGTETYNAFVHMLASGQKIVKKDGDDVPYLSFQNETMYNVLGDIMEFYTDEDHVMVANGGRFDGKYTTNVWEETIIKAFREGRELFYMGGLINIVGYRTLDFNFGILPIPKHFEDQDEYYHSVSMHNMSCLAVPNGAADYDDLGILIEALGAESKNKVTPVYYEKCMKSQYLKDEEDEEMLDIIFNSRCFDLGSVFNWGGVLSEFMKLDSNFVSRFDSIAEAAQTALDETLEYFEK